MKKKFKYSTDNTSFKKLSLVYPYNTSLFANVFFHVLDHDYDADSLDDLLDEYEEKYRGKTVYSDEDDEIFNDETEAFSDEDDYDDSDFDEEESARYLESLYIEYADDVAEYMTDHLLCDFVCGYKLANSEDYDNITDVINETDRSKYKFVVVGIKFTNPIDEKLFNKYQSIIVSDIEFTNSYNDLRRYNLSIINTALNDNGLCMSNISTTILNILAKYISQYSEYMTMCYDRDITIELDDGRIIPMVNESEAFFPMTVFKLQLDLNYYNINEPMLNNLLDNVYGTILRFGNAINILSDEVDKIEIFKYDNDTKSCIFVKNETGGTYLFLNGYKSK